MVGTKWSDGYMATEKKIRENLLLSQYAKYWTPFQNSRLTEVLPTCIRDNYFPSLGVSFPPSPFSHSCPLTLASRFCRRHQPLCARLILRPNHGAVVKKKISFLKPEKSVTRRKKKNTKVTSLSQIEVTRTRANPLKFSLTVEVYFSFRYYLI
ncbi:hypothetical protein L873DRAFT_1315083 [Choiromyces venosus 120613-1]|uniref:Uncharacterized protein n=1 Tax=Choiromyces venosus 120613-1 TaxID=1336337 RepID=A0A3N4JBA6_9PEZI|nr:hypothetical protein L873DRAFT_1315083 [Choiromyces venosus 120613-1]